MLCWRAGARSWAGYLRTTSNHKHGAYLIEHPIWPVFFTSGASKALALLVRGASTHSAEC